MTSNSEAVTRSRRKHADKYRAYRRQYRAKNLERIREYERNYQRARRARQKEQKETEADGNV